jgi:hypothetical protein
MKNILTIALLLFAFTILAQDKIYTKGLPNGYAWTAPISPRPPVYAKDESLMASLIQRKQFSNIDSSLNHQSFPLDCDSDVHKLLKDNNSIDYKDIVKLIDEFYLKKENLIIPVLGAYCYSIKKLNGTNSEELEVYLDELLKYSSN